MTTATARVTQKGSIWSAIISWPFGHRFVSGLSNRDLRMRIAAVSRAIGRPVMVELVTIDGGYEYEPNSGLGW